MADVGASLSLFVSPTPGNIRLVRAVALQAASASASLLRAAACAGSPAGLGLGLAKP